MGGPGATTAMLLYCNVTKALVGTLVAWGRPQARGSRQGRGKRPCKDQIVQSALTVWAPWPGKKAAVVAL